MVYSHIGSGESRRTLLYRSPYKKDTLNPEWEPFLLRVADVGGPDTPFTIEVLHLRFFSHILLSFLLLILS